MAQIRRSPFVSHTSTVILGSTTCYVCTIQERRGLRFLFVVPVSVFTMTFISPFNDIHDVIVSADGLLVNYCPGSQFHLESLCTSCLGLKENVQEEIAGVWRIRECVLVP